MKKAICVTLLFGLGVSPVQAGENGLGLDGGAVTISLMPAITAYPGSHEKGYASVLPSLSFHKSGEKLPFSAPDDGFDLPLLTFGKLTMGPLFDLRKRRVTADVQGTHLASGSLVPQAGFAMTGWFSDQWRWRAEWREGISMGDRGTRFDLASDYVIEDSSRLWSIGPRIVYGNSTYMNRQFASNGETLRSGLESIGFAGSLTQPVAKDVSLTGFARMDRFVGGTARTAIVQTQDARVAMTTGLGLNYTFNWK